MIAVSNITAILKKTHFRDALFTCNVVLFAFLLSASFFPKINAFKEFFNKYNIRVSKSLNPNQVKHFISPDLGPNCLQRLSADESNQHT